MLLARNLNLRKVARLLQSSYCYCTLLFPTGTETMSNALNWSKSTTKHTKMVTMDQNKCLHRRAEVLRTVPFLWCYSHMVFLVFLFVLFLPSLCYETVITVPRVYAFEMIRIHSCKSILWCLFLGLTCTPFFLSMSFTS